MCHRFDLEGTFCSLAGEYNGSPIGVLGSFDAILTRSLAPKDCGPILLFDLTIEMLRRGYRATLGFTSVQP